MLQGWRVIRVTWNDLCDQPGSVVASIERALAADS